MNIEFLDDIKSETIIICKSGFKNYLLKQKKLYTIKIYTLNEFIHLYCFDYDYRTILYISDKYNLKYDIAKMYLDNLYYVDDVKYGIKKLDFLCELKKDLIRNNLLIYNDNFKKYISNKKVILYDIPKTKYLSKLFNDLDCEYIDRKFNNYKHNVISFNTMNEEVEYVAYQISKLIDNGIDIKNIKLTNVDKSYYSSISRIFYLYNLKVNIHYKYKLSSYKIVSDFIDLYKKNTLEESINQLDKNDSVYIDLVSVINKYLKYESKDIIVYELNNSYINDKKYDNGIEIIDYLDYISNDNEYIFMLGFNDGVIPNSYKDTDYITDNIKQYVLLDDTSILNKRLREDILNNIANIKNLTITYKDMDYVKTYYPSTLIGEFDVIHDDIDYSVSYSSTYNKMKLTKMYDEYLKYGYKDKYFSILYNNYKINYNSYSNKYSKIGRVFDHLTLSYSKMQKYIKCSFQYYLSDVLKLDVFESNFSTVIGSMVHYVMENTLKNNDYDYSKYVDEFLNDITLTKKERFFLEQYKEAIRGLLDEVILERDYCSLNNAMYEEEIKVELEPNIYFVGIIDKILYTVLNDKTYIALIDYKTGNDVISLKYLTDGMYMQLPIYLYLSSKMLFQNPVYVGFYLQRFNIKENDYRLIGYSNCDKNILSMLDNNYDNSKIIKGMKTSKDGSFYKNAKVLSNEEMDKIKEIAEKKILEVVDNIKNNKFDINPKVINGVNKGCEFCKFKDICFVTKSDYTYLNGSDDFG